MIKSTIRQGFSGTDLCKDPLEPGVCYPLGADNNDKPNFAGIMVVKSKRCLVAHYEYRIANGDLGTDISYSKGSCVAIVDKPPTTVSAVQQLLGETPIDQTYYTTNGTDLAPIHETIAAEFYTLGFEPFTKAIDPSHLSTPAPAPSVFGKFSLFSKPVTDYSKLTIYDAKKLNTLTTKDLYKQYLSVATAYYEGNKSFIFALTEFETTGQLIEEILDIQESIAMEQADSIPAIKAKLSAFGMAKSVLESTSHDQLRKWNANLDY